MEMFGHLNFTVLGFPCNQFGLQSPGKVDNRDLYCFVMGALHATLQNKPDFFLSLISD